VAAAPSARPVGLGWWGWLGRYGLLTGAIILFSGCLILSLHRLREQHATELIDVGMSLWLSTQADFELQRLRHALDAYALGHEQFTHDDLLERFEIFWSRLPLLVEGPDSASIREASGTQALVPAMIAELEAMEPGFRALRPRDAQTHAQLAERLGAFAPPLHDIVVRVENSLGQANQNRLATRRQLYLEQAAYLIGILLSGGILVTLLFRETTRARQLLAEANAARHRVWHLAHHDPVTQLPNRWLFEDRLAQAIRQVPRDGRSIALHYLDLDHFKTVNDSFGHVVGDGLLVAVAHRLRTVLRDSDTLARLGGDEFAVIQTGVRDAAGARLLGERLINALHAPLEVDGRILQVTISGGVGLYPDHASDATELHQVADRAMYAAKAAGRDGCHLYDPGPTARAEPRHALAG
jgi:diguanylate cyclase (GGDEF)-like protein